MIPGIARRAAVLAFSFLIIPVIHDTMPPGEPNLWMFSIIAMKEAFIGFVIGFFSAVPFWISESVGNFIDNQRGATMGEVYSPLSGTQVSTFGIFFSQITSTIFFVSGAILLLLGALYKSFEIWPVFSIGVEMTADAATNILFAVDDLMRKTVVISAPVIIVMFLATLGLGLVNRTAPQLNVFFLSMPVKSALGIALLVIYLPFILDMLMYTKDTDILHPAMTILKEGG
jgi:type III secretion protein T